MTKLEKAVFATVAYCDQFQYPLTLKEITSRLMYESPVALTEVKAVVEKLVQRGKIVRSGIFFQLSNSPEWGTTRQHRAQISQEKWLSAKKFALQAQKIPWVEAIAVTGSLAMDNATPEADVDFCIVTKPHRLWLTRLWVSWLAVKAGRRRSWHVEKPNSWCFNLWLDSEHLALEKPFQSVYGAYEVIQAVWILDSSGVQAAFYDQNQWVGQYLANAAVEMEHLKKNQNTRKNNKVDGFLGFLEKAAYAVQFYYMKRHMTRERVGEGWAFFHPRDTRKLVEKKWRAKL